jgi:hypothetical protein
MPGFYLQICLHLLGPHVKPIFRKIKLKQQIDPKIRLSAVKNNKYWTRFNIDSSDSELFCFILETIANSEKKKGNGKGFVPLS